MRSILSVRRGTTLLAAVATGVAVLAVPSIAEAGTAAITINSVAPNPFSPNGNSPNNTTFVEFAIAPGVTDVGVQVTNGVTDVYDVDLGLPGGGGWTWDGKDNASQLVPDGTYTITLTASGSVSAPRCTMSESTARFRSCRRSAAAGRRSTRSRTATRTPSHRR